MKVRVRFAPSPTGNLHVGSARTALFNWLFARGNKGKFLLRVEDTDIERSKEEFLEEILNSLKWLGMDWDEEPMHQSKRLDVYRKKAQELLKADLAYEQEGRIHDKDGNVTTDSDRIKQKAIIFKVPRGEKIAFDDLVHGKIEVDTDTIKDQVMIKSDGFPTYNFACVIDDADMDITHIIRGDDHISNTPKQILFYKALKLKLPQFVHIPLILGTDKSRMSKRHGATSIREYKEQGFLHEALVNFIALLGWAPGGDREIMALNDIIKEFSLENIKKAGGVFDVEKLKWMNGEYINKLTDEEFLDLVLLDLKQRELVREPIDKEWLLKVVALFKQRTQTLVDFLEWSEYVFMEAEEIRYGNEAIDKRLRKVNGLEILEKTKEKFFALSDFSTQTTETACRELAEEMKIKPAEIIHAVRVAVSGRMIGPSLFELLEVLGKEKVVKRLELAKGLL